MLAGKTDQGAGAMRVRTVILAAALALSPLSATAADLVVWWEKGFYPEEDQAIEEVVADFEKDTGRTVELVFLPIIEIQDKAQAALEGTGQAPDFLWGTFGGRRIPQWAHEDRLLDLTNALTPLAALFDPDAFDQVVMPNASTGQRGVYALPMGRNSNHVHVWKSLLEQAGFSLDHIPKEWAAFWSFWCDEVQPAVRRATGRNDVWGVGLPMSATGLDTHDQLTQFQLAYGTPWLSGDGRLQLDDPKARSGLVRAIDAYTAVWRKDCTPPDALDWTNSGNNKAFLTQRVVMTVNETLSIPGALRAAQPEEYYANAVTIDWPNAADGRPLVIDGGISRAVVFKAGGNTALAESFVSFLVRDGGLARWLSSAGDRIIPPMRQLLDQPFWLDASDPHRMHAALQTMTRPHRLATEVRDHPQRSGQIWQENVWGQAVHRVAAEGWTPEQAVDEAIARINQILSE
jgi:multiple sugar transport system substrate-binding protein